MTTTISTTNVEVDTELKLQTPNNLTRVKPMEKNFIVNDVNEAETVNVVNDNVKIQRKDSTDSVEKTRNIITVNKNKKRVNFKQSDIEDSIEYCIQSGYHSRNPSEINVPPNSPSELKVKEDKTKPHILKMDDINDTIFRYASGFTNKCPEGITGNESIEVIGAGVAKVKVEYTNDRMYGFSGYAREEINNKFNIS